VRRFFPFIAGLAILGILAVGAWWRLWPDAATAADSTAAAGATETSAGTTFSTEVAIPVEGAEVVQGPLILSVSAAAQSAAARETNILAQVNGRVMRLPVRENQTVRAGQILLQIDSTEYAMDFARAEALYAQAEASFRELTLFDDQITDSAVRAERSRVARARSGLDREAVNVRVARLQLERSTVRAPFAGRVASIQIVEGQNVRAGDELLTVVDLDPIRVETEVLESEIGWLAEGRGAAVTFAAFPGEVFRGTIETINPMVDRDTRTARVTVRLPNRDGRVLPGMYARVALEARRFEDRILVPRAAILERDRRTMLFVYEDGLAKWRYVTTGLQNDSLIEIVRHPDTEMVRAGETVLTNGHYTLIHDARVTVVAAVRGEAGGRPR